MYNKKTLATLFLFSFISIMVVFVAINSERSADKSFKKGEIPDEVSTFLNVHFYKTENNIQKVELQASELIITNQDLLRFSKPNGLIFNKDRSISYEADKGELIQSSKLLTLNGSVILKDLTSIYKAGLIIYDGIKSIITASDNVNSQYKDLKTKDVVKLKSDNMLSQLDDNILYLDGNVNGRIIKNRKYEMGLSFSSENVVLNSPESRLSLSNKVKLFRNNYYLQAQKAEVFLENFNKKLKYYELYDDVKLEESFKLSSGKIQKRRAYAEKLEAHQSSGKLILTGAPRVEQGKDVIRGYQITLRENVELVEVDDSQSSFSLSKEKNGKQ